MAPAIVVVTGAESTGKSTLAAALALALDAPLVPEFARTYAERVGRPLTAADVEPIARGQVAAEDAAREQAEREQVPGHEQGGLVRTAGQRRAGSLLILDTDLLSTMVYARHYYGDAMPELETLVRARRSNLYLLCEPDFSFAADPVRDSEAARALLQARFVAATCASQVATMRMRGPHEQRLSDALARIEQMLASHP